MLDLVNAAALAEEVQAEEEDDLDQSAATLQAAFRGRSSRRRGRRARQRYLARCAARVTNAIRSQAYLKAKAMRAAECFDGRIASARCIQRKWRRVQAQRKRLAAWTQARFRGDRGRRKAAARRFVARAGRSLQQACAKSLHRRRGAVLLERLRSYDAAARPPCAIAAERELVELAARDAAAAAVEPADRVRRTKRRKALPLWLAPGLPASDAARAFGARRALAALPADDIGHPLDGVAGPLLALALSHWQCALQSLALVDCADALGSDSQNAVALGGALGGCRSLRALAVLGCGLGPKTADALFDALRASGLALERLHVDEERRAWLPPARGTGPALGAAAGRALGDYVFQQLGRLAVLHVSRAGLGDAGGAALGAGLGRCALTELRLDGNGLGDAAAAGLAAGLATAPRLLVLALPRNAIGDAGLAALLGALRRRGASGPRPAGSGRLDLADNHTTCAALPFLLRSYDDLSRDPTFDDFDVAGNAWLPHSLAALAARRERRDGERRALGEDRRDAALRPPSRQTAETRRRAAALGAAAPRGTGPPRHSATGPSPRRFLQAAAATSPVDRRRRRADKKRLALPALPVAPLVAPAAERQAHFQ